MQIYCEARHGLHGSVSSLLLPSKHSPQQPILGMLLPLKYIFNLFTGLNKPV
jgi:hypothetical protein